MKTFRMGVRERATSFVKAELKKAAKAVRRLSQAAMSSLKEELVAAVHGLRDLGVDLGRLVLRGVVWMLNYVLTEPLAMPDPLNRGLVRMKKSAPMKKIMKSGLGLCFATTRLVLRVVVIWGAIYLGSLLLKQVTSVGI